jgi:hypothetical protein
MAAADDAQPLEDGPDELPVGNGPAGILGEVQAEMERSLLEATRTDAGLPEGEGDEELVMAVGAADPSRCAGIERSPTA